MLHGVGEPMLVKDLPRMIRYLKDRGIYVLFNTNGTLLNPRKFQELIDTGLDELRVSVDAADRKTYLAVRGKDFFDRIVRDVGKFTAFQARVGSATPKVSIWLTGLKETVQQLPEFVRMAATMGVREVHLQRLVFDDAGFGMARAENSLFEQTQVEEEQSIAAAQAIGAALGVTLDASGATEPGVSLKNKDGDTPWATCRRPWSLMYFTAHGRALPCCIAPFSARGYSNYTLGRCHAAEPAGDLERGSVQGFPPQPAERYTAETVRELRAEVVAVGDCTVMPGPGALSFQADRLILSAPFYRGRWRRSRRRGWGHAPRPSGCAPSPHPAPLP